MDPKGPASHDTFTAAELAKIAAGDTPSGIPSPRIRAHYAKKSGMIIAESSLDTSTTKSDKKP